MNATREVGTYKLCFTSDGWTCVFPMGFLNHPHKGVWLIFYLPSTSQKHVTCFKQTSWPLVGCQVSRWEIYFILWLLVSVSLFLSPKHKSSSELLPGCQCGQPSHLGCQAFSRWNKNLFITGLWWVSSLPVVVLHQQVYWTDGERF